MSACACTGPQNGQPLCPCQMRALYGAAEGFNRMPPDPYFAAWRPYKLPDRTMDGYQATLLRLAHLEEEVQRLSGIIQALLTDGAARVQTTPAAMGNGTPT